MIDIQPPESYGFTYGDYALKIRHSAEDSKFKKNIFNSPETLFHITPLFGILEWPRFYAITIVAFFFSGPVQPKWSNDVLVYNKRNGQPMASGVKPARIQMVAAAAAAVVR